MIQRLRTSGRLRETIVFGSLAGMCFAFSLFRWEYTDTKTFLFLNWNLILAIVPWIISTGMVVYPRMRRPGLGLIVLMSIWLLFFPNAPYILTDLFHLRKNTGMPIWFDLTLILFFAWTGLLFGFSSLRDVQKMLSALLNPRLAVVITVILIFAGSFGIYLGRYLRWNSWDIIQEPYSLIYQIGDRFVNPLDHPRAWGMTLFLGLFLNVVYFTLFYLNTSSRYQKEMEVKSR